MATSIVDIDQGAGWNYTSVEAFDAGEARDLTSAAEIDVAQVRSSSGSAYTASFSIDDGGWVTNSSYYVRVISDESNRFTSAEYDNTKVRWEGVDRYASGISDVTVDYTEYIGLQFKGNSSGGNGANIVNDVSATGVLIDKCIFEAGYDAGGPYETHYGVLMASASASILIRNSLFYGFGTAAIADNYVAATVGVYNCTIMNNAGIGVDRNSGTFTMINNIVGNNTGSDVTGTISSANYNCTDDGMHR